MGVFFISLWIIEEVKVMFTFYEFRYYDKRSKLKFVFYARTVEFADHLAKRMTDLGVYVLVRKKFFFMKKVYSGIPPYEIEQEQEETIDGYEEYNKTHREEIENIINKK